MDESLELCGFCRDILTQKTEIVRLLPCKHSFCHLCLVEDQRVNRQTTCPVCRVTLGKIDIDELPMPIYNTLHQKMASSSSTGTDKQKGAKKKDRKCFICQTVAKNRCFDCGQFTCNVHKDNHSCDEEDEVSTAQVVRPCSQHKGEEVHLACKQCLQVFCDACVDEEDNECPSEEGSLKKHKLCSLKAAANKFREILDDELVTANDAKEKLQKCVKSTYQDLDSVEESGRKFIEWHKAQIAKITEFMELARTIATDRVSSMEETEKTLDDAVTKIANLRDEADDVDVSYEGGSLRVIVSSAISKNHANPTNIELSTSRLQSISGANVSKELVQMGAAFGSEADKLLNSHTFMYAHELLNPRTVFKYAHDFDENGIIYWIGTNGRTAGWVNPHDQKLMKVTCSEGANVFQGTLSSVVEHTRIDRQSTYTNDTQNSWFAIDLGVKVIPAQYTLRKSAGGENILRNWQLQGSNYGTAWTTIKQHDNDASLAENGTTYTWNLNVNAEGSDGWSHYRIYETGAGSAGTHYLDVGGFEIYGAVTTFSVNNGWPLELKEKIMKLAS